MGCTPSGCVTSSARSTGSGTPRSPPTPFRTALAAHGYALNAMGEIRQLADFVDPCSARAGQIARNLDRYEREWIAAHPGEHPGPALPRAWDARAWADGRPDKVTPQSGADLTARWRAELGALGYRDANRPVDLASTPAGALDRDHAVQRMLAKSAAGRSAWSAADIRGEAEQLIAAAGIVADASVRDELAEDLTARAVECCLPLLAREGVPEHIRAWTSRPVLDVEADLTTRLGARSTGPDADTPQTSLQASRAAGRLDAGQAAAVAALAGDRALVVVEGAAGAAPRRARAAHRSPAGRLAALQRRVAAEPELRGPPVVAGPQGCRARRVHAARPEALLRQRVDRVGV